MAGPTELTSPAVGDALIILAAAGAVIPVFARFRITPIIGFILVGLLIGPFGLGRLVPLAPWLEHVTIADPKTLAPVAEMGIILLLFSIGLELSFARLWSMRRHVFGLGALELVISALLVAALLMVLGNSLPTALAAMLSGYTMAAALAQSGGKVLACGSGRSGALSQAFVVQFVARYERERPGLGALALALPINPDRLSKA